jgi:RING finger/CHY zinc finger protein 1
LLNSDSNSDSDSDSTNINSYNDLQEQNRLSQATLPSAEDLQNIDSSYEQEIKDYYKTNGSPCNHYKRKCLVKIEDDDKFYPCHKCYNNKKAITDKKLIKKSRNTTALKCLECEHEQLFDPATGSNCLNCGAKFAVYYCGSCKHLTGMDDHPYHCEKCGICRIHGDRSFHCDICGVCLDVQLKNNHRCRAGSEHDECCICLEDAFTGCQILPCSHKVHKECSVQMIRSGIMRCPVCNESFAHKLERRPSY